VKLVFGASYPVGPNAGGQTGGEGSWSPLQMPSPSKPNASVSEEISMPSWRAGVVDHPD
jgi:hypothetical protein